MDVRVDSHRAEVIEACKEGIEVALEAIGIQFESHAKANITQSGRVDTGAMRNSIAHQVVKSENAVYIGTNLEYAIYNEVGTGIYAEGGGGRKTPWAYKDTRGDWHTTVGMTPIHFLKCAGSEHEAEYKAIAEKHLKE